MLVFDIRKITDYEREFDIREWFWARRDSAVDLMERTKCTANYKIIIDL